MSILSTVTTGVTRNGIRAVISGQEKIGKTTLCCGAPDVLLVPLEVGYGGTTVSKTVMLTSYAQVVQLLNEIIQRCAANQFPHKTLVLDSVTALERYIHDYVLALDPTYKNASKTITMESAHGGYGKAYIIANNVFDNLLKALDLLAVQYGINVIFTSHVFSSRVSDPTIGEYDCWDLLLHSPKNQRTYGKREMITQWADLIGFIYEPVYLASNEKGTSSRAISQNKGRVLALSRTPAFVAGNRFNIVGEIPMPPPPDNGWNHLAMALYQHTGIDVFKR